MKKLAMEFMQNPGIKSETKKYVADRTEKLLADNSRFRTKVSIINRYLVDGEKGVISNILFKAEKLFASVLYVFSMFGSMFGSTDFTYADF